MIKEKMLFVVNTEIGLLVALLYYLKYHKHNYEAIFVLLRGNSNRFKNLNKRSLPGKTYIYKNELTSNILFPNRQFEESLLFDNIASVVIQNPLDFASQVILNSYRKKNKNLFTVMLSDGLLLERGIYKFDYIKLFLKNLIRKFVNNFKYLPICLKLYPSMIKNIDEFIAHKNIGAKNFINTSDLIQNTVKCNEKIISDIFNFDITAFKDSKMIVFTQPLFQQTYITEKEKYNYKNVLYRLSLFAIENNIQTVIKLHPGDDLNEYKDFQNQLITIDKQKNIPAEIILSSVDNIIVISMFSSVSLYNTNYKNKHFWLYQLMDYKLPAMDMASHINIPNSFDKFENEILHFVREEK